MLRIELGPAGLKVQMLPLCYVNTKVSFAVTFKVVVKLTFFFVSVLRVRQLDSSSLAFLSLLFICLMLLRTNKVKLSVDEGSPILALEQL